MPQVYRICIRGRGTHVYTIEHINLSTETPDIPRTAITVSGHRRGPVTRSVTCALTASQPNPSKANPATASKGPQVAPNTEPLNLADIATTSKPLYLATTSTMSPQAPKSAKDDVSQFEQELSAEYPLTTIGTISTLVSSPPPTLVIKESWPYEDHAALEPQMFLDIKGKHGAPDIAGAITYSEELRPFTNLKDFKKCTDFPSVYSTDTPCPQSESRVLVCMLCATQSTSLITIVDQHRKLIRTLLDGMIGLFLYHHFLSFHPFSYYSFIHHDAGHMHLFLAGYLHRDVTIGNILVRHNIKKRTEALRENNCDALCSRECVFFYITSNTS
jgi:hypothetical protein